MEEQPVETGWWRLLKKTIGQPNRYPNHVDKENG
jgi:hypothetical protein